MKSLIVLLLMLTTVVGFFIAAYVFRLGLEVALERHGALFTIIAGRSLLPLCLCLALLVDTARGRHRW